MTFSYFESADQPAIHVVEDMRDGLELALGENKIKLTNENREDAVIGVSPDLLWVNKAAYRAINEIPQSGELPVLYSWFRYGPSVPIPIFQTNRLDPTTLGRYNGKLEDSRRGSSHTVYEYFEFFDELIREDEFFDPDKTLAQYLLELYNDAPISYENLYKKNVRIQELLADFKNITDDTPMTEERVDEYYQKFEPAKSQFERSLYRTSEIPADSKDHVIDFLNLIDGVLESFKGVDFISRAQQNPVNNLWYKYQKYTWPWPANWISYNTSVSKPAATDFQEYLESEIATQKSEWQHEVQALRIRLRDTGMLDEGLGRTQIDIGSEAVAQIGEAILRESSASQTHE